MRRLAPKPTYPGATVARVADDRPDLDAIDAVARACFDGDPSISLREELARPWSRLWVASRDGEPIGFLASWHVADELHVLNVGTLPEARRQGVATGLMNVAMEYAKDHRVRIVLLEVRRSNRAAIRLYRTLGFTAMGVRPRYYGDNDEDAIEMVLALDPVTGVVIPMRDEVPV